MAGRLLIVPGRFWVLGLFLLAALIGFASVLATMRISARATDPQAAVQITSLFVLPGFLIVLGAVGKLLLSSVSAVLIVAAVVALANLWLLRLNLAKFGREEILTRWN